MARRVEKKFGPLPNPEVRVTNMPRDEARNRKRGFAERSVDLCQCLTPLTDVTDYPLTRVSVTREGRLLGYVDIANQYQLIGATRLRDEIVREFSFKLLKESETSALDSVTDETLATLRRHYLPKEDGLETDICSELPSYVPVSVVVATYDRPDHLRKCLRCLTAQETLRQVEIVVVDNHPSSHLTPPVVAEFPGVVLVSDPRQGLSYARNAGIVASKGKIIIATDDDVTIPSDWLEKLIAPFRRDDVVIVTGNVLPLELETSAQRLFEVYGGLGRGFERLEADGDWFESFGRRAVPTWKLGSTANAAFRASIFSDPQIGLMDEALGPGTPAGAGEDTYLFYKVLKTGYTLVYEPEAYVWHTHRRDISDLRRQIYGYSKGHVAYHLTTLIHDYDLRALIRILWELPKWHLLRIKDWVLGGRRTYPLSLILFEMAGNLAGPWALWRSRRRVKREGNSKPYVPFPQRSLALQRTSV
jgi:GT2 family glycosyltransferase